MNELEEASEKAQRGKDPGDEKNFPESLWPGYQVCTAVTKLSITKTENFQGHGGKQTDGSQ